MAQPSQPTFINLPPPGSNPETPSEMPGTPTSTTTSLSTLSTTAIKDGHRGHFASGPHGRGHQHSPSTTSLEAERADRISRLAGLERVSTLRSAPNPSHSHGHGPPSALSVLSTQTTPTSTAGFPANFPASQHLTPAYFDSNGQPVAVTKMSTVGSASATESHVGDADDARTTAGDRDEDMLSTDTNYREGGSVASMGPDHDAMDEDMDTLATRSVGGYEDRMSDDGSASLVGFGEGAGSTVSGPIYHRRLPPGAGGISHQPSGLERTNSGLSSDARRERDTQPQGTDTPISASVAQERRDARMMDGIAADPPLQPTLADPEPFVDTTARGPLPSSTRTPAREATEAFMQALDSGEQRPGVLAGDMGSPGRREIQPWHFSPGETRDD